jgi:cytochrome P450
MISSMTEKMCGRIEEFRRSGQPLKIQLPYACFTTDVVTKFTMARSWDRLDSPDFSPLWCKTASSSAGLGAFLKHYPWLFGVSKAMPDRLVASISPGMLLVLNWQRDLERYVKDIMEGKEDKEGKETVDGKPTVFHHLLNSDLPPQEKTLERLWQEGQVIVGAGTETTANTLTITTFHLLDNPEKLKRLRSELETVMPDPSSPAKLQELEQLPYFSAVVNEGLRMSYGVSQRLPRIAPNEELTFRDWTIPRGTPVSMTTLFIHHDETIFPDSHTFLPERWFEPAPNGRPLDRYLVSFTKGSRQCAGINLARAELYIALAQVFRRFDLELFETDRSDVDIKHDFFVPHPKLDSKGVRVLVK